MRRSGPLIRLVILMLLLSSAGACVASAGMGPWPWHYTNRGVYTVVRRPVVVVDGWTRRAFRGYHVRRHHSQATVVGYSASKGDMNVEVDLSPTNDSTRIEVRARKGEAEWDQEYAKDVLGRILKDYE